MKRIAAIVLLGVVAVGSSVFAQGLPEGVGAPLPEAVKSEIKALFEVGRKAMAEKDLQTAYNAYEQISRLDPGNPESFYQMAVVHFLNRDYQRGIPLIEQSVSLAPNNVVLRFSYARALKEAGVLPQAIEQYAMIKGGSEINSKNWLEAERQLQLLDLRVSAAEMDVDGVDHAASVLQERFFDDPAVLNSIGLAYLDTRRYDAAERTYLELAKLRPGSALPSYYLGVVYESLKRYDEAELQYQNSLQIDNDSPVADTVRIKLGLIRGLRYYEKGNHVLAQREFEAVVKKDPRNVLATVNLGALYIDNKAYDQAIELLAPLAHRVPNNIQARLRLGAAYLEKQRLVEGIRELDYVIQHTSDPQQKAQAEDLLQRLQSRSSGNIDKLRELAAEQSVYEDVLAQDETDDAAQLGIAEILFRQRRMDEAQVTYAKVIELNPYNAKAHKRLASILESQGKSEEALEHYAIALSLYEDEDEVKNTQVRVWGIQARYFFDNKEYGEAERFYGNMLERQERNPVALWGSAMTQARAGDTDEAVEIYEKLLEHYPTQHSARTNLALLLEQLGREEEAIPHYQTVLQDRKISEQMRASATRRLRSLKRRINGFGYSAGYTMAFDDNASLSEDNKLFEYRSTTSARLSYNYKMNDDWRFSMDVSPSYTIYHQGQFDFVSLSASPRLRVSKGDWDGSMGWDYFSQSGLLRPEDSRSISNSITLDGSWRPVGKPSYQTALVYRQFESRSSPFFDAENLTLMFTTSRLLSPKLSVTYRYAFANNENSQDLGSDYAYFGHDFSASLNRRYSAKFSVFANAGLALNLYKNPDSSTGFEDKRRNWALTLVTGGTYRINDTYTVFGSYSLNVQRSNLPVGFVLNELQTIEGLQSASLGSYDRQQVSVGLRINF